MAEFPDAGKHCSLESCQQLDFLPLICDGCHRTFCKIHSPFDNHQCQNRPNCELKVIVKRTSIPTNHGTCELSSCDVSGSDLMPLVECRICSDKFCMNHRNELDHKCKAKQAADGEHVMAKTRETVTNILTKNSEGSAKKTDKKLSTKNAKMGAKVQLMKLKQNADGSKGIVTEDRIYFRVHFPTKKLGAVSSKNVFVSKLFSVGKIIDVLADLCQIENPNNSSNSSKKLRIFRRIDGDIWSTDLTEILESMILAEKAFNGESIILEYSESPEILSSEIFSLYQNVK